MLLFFPEWGLKGGETDRDTKTSALVKVREVEIDRDLMKFAAEEGGEWWLKRVVMKFDVGKGGMGGERDLRNSVFGE